MQKEIDKYVYICYSAEDETILNIIKNGFEKDLIPYFECNNEFKNKKENLDLVKEKIINSSCFLFVYTKNIFSNLGIMKEVIIAFENNVPIITYQDDIGSRKIGIYDYLITLFRLDRSLSFSIKVPGLEILNKKIINVLTNPNDKPNLYMLRRDILENNDPQKNQLINKIMSLCISEYISLINSDYSSLDDNLNKLKELVLKFDDYKCYEEYNKLIMHYDAYKNIDDNDPNYRLHCYYIKELLIGMLKFVEAKYAEQSTDYYDILKNSY